MSSSSKFSHAVDICVHSRNYTKWFYRFECFSVVTLCDLVSFLLRKLLVICEKAEGDL